MAGLVGGVHDLVVEYGKVERKTQADGVGGRKVSLGDLGGVLISLEGQIGRLLAAVTKSELGKVAVVVSLPARN